MKNLEQMSDRQFERYALGVLERELGLGGTARFLRLSRSGHGDYTAERGKWHGELTIDAIAEAIETRRISSSKRS